MNNIALLVIIVLSILAALLVIRIWFKRLEEKQTAPELTQWLADMSRRIDSSTSLFSQLQKEIGTFSEIGRSMKDLQDFLSSPKLRGNIGEQVLKDLLAQHFPHTSYKLQHSFRSGDKVDAVIKTQSGLIPIDSKFPMENYRKMNKAESAAERERMKKEFVRDVKKHQDDIARKYILTAEGTVDYAIMYIPSESVYYEIINSSDLFDFGGQKRILPVSPLSFFAYMKAILMSLEGQQIETKAKEILNVLGSMQKDYEKTADAFSVLHRHLTNAYNQSAQVNNNLSGLGQKLSSTRLLSDSKK